MSGSRCLATRGWLLAAWPCFKFGLPTTARQSTTTAKGTASSRSWQDRSGSKTTPISLSRTMTIHSHSRRWTTARTNTPGYQNNPSGFTDWSTSTTKPAWTCKHTTTKTNLTSSSQWLKRVKPVMPPSSFNFILKMTGRTILTCPRPSLIYLKLTKISSTVSSILTDSMRMARKLTMIFTNWPWSWEMSTSMPEICNLQLQKLRLCWATPTRDKW